MILPYLTSLSPLFTSSRLSLLALTLLSSPFPLPGYLLNSQSVTFGDFFGGRDEYLG